MCYFSIDIWFCISESKCDPNKQGWQKPKSLGWGIAVKNNQDRFSGKFWDYIVFFFYRSIHLLNSYFTYLTIINRSS